jgi:signal transduction histidine kinase
MPVSLNLLPLHELAGAILEHVPVAVILLDGLELRLAYANPAFGALFVPAAPPRNLIGLRLHDLFDADEQAELIALLREARYAGGSARREGLRFGSLGQGTGEWQVIAAPLPDRLDGVLLQFTPDTTGTADPQATFEQLKDDFLAITAHELRTPVTALLGYINLMLRYVDQGDWNNRDVHALRMIQAQAQQLTQRINSLVDMSRIQTGVIELRCQQVDLHGLAREVVDGLQTTVGDHAIEVEGEAPVVVWGDRQRLEQVLSQLVDNAVKYSPWGGAVRIRVWVDDAAHVAVIDSGIGIPEGDLPQLFQRFYRASNVDSDRISGLGIGLYLVREFVAAHKGQIEIQSTPDQGTTVSITLPRYEEQSDDAHDGDTDREAQPL